MAKKKKKADLNSSAMANIMYQIFDLAQKEKSFLTILIVITVICGVVSPYPDVAMWVVFALAGYSAIANDSIQTIGTFIASNGKKPWYILWLFMGIIFLMTIGYSWFQYNGDISYQRLQTTGLDQAPTSFSFLQLFAPVVLLILTRMRMPVSTSILLLSAFTTKVSSIGDILAKSFFGYVLAFTAAMIIWSLITRLFDTYAPKGKNPESWWMPLQWVTSGLLWSVWIMQDMANIVVVLPRNLGVEQFIAVAVYIFLGLGLLFYLKGDKIQGIVNEKKNISDVRAATIVDFVYFLLLYYLKFVSTIPISTTWVFIGLLGGRELAMSIQEASKKKRLFGIRNSLRIVKKDAIYAAIGLIVSIILALAINDVMREQVYESIFGS
jgi:hypothetical protein